MEPLKFKELKRKLEDKFLKEGFLDIEDLENNDLTREQYEELWKWLSDKKIRVLKPYQAYLNRLSTIEEKVDFCYYAFICLFIGVNVDITKYDRNLARYQKGVVNFYLENECSPQELRLIRKQYGLDNGEIFVDQSDLFNALGYHSLDIFNKDSIHTHLIMRPEYKYHYCLKNMLKAIDDGSFIGSYRFNKKQCKDNTDELALVPYDYNGALGIGGATTAWSLEPDEPISEGTRMLAWVDGTRYLHYLHINKPDYWFFSYINGPKPHVTMEYKEGGLAFEMHYGNIGYHGNRYVIKPGKFAVVENWDKGKLISSTTLDFVIEANFEGIFSFQPISEDAVGWSTDEEQNFIFSTRDKQKEYFFCSKIFYKNGDSITGFSTKNGFCETVLRHRGFEDDFEYLNYTDGKPVENSPRLIASGGAFPQQIALTFYNKHNHKCVLLYNPSETLNELEFCEFDDDEKNIINSADLSNPFFKKSLVKEIKPVSDDDPEVRLNKLIGLESVKVQIARLKAILRKDKDKRNINLNMVFSGNPGTGKTVVARLLGAILYKEGILKSDKFVEVDRSTVIGRYMGETEQKVQELIKSAMGGVFFVDEAYALYSRWGEEGADYGRNALDTLVKAMEDYRGQICFIFAGYKYPMLQMMSLNPGFKSRVNRFIEFPNYSVDELKQIGLKMAAENDRVLEEGVIDEIVKILEPKMEESDFANARDMRNILETIYEIQALRTYNDPENYTITMDDIKTYERDIDFVPEIKRETPKISLVEIIQQRNLLHNIPVDGKYMQEVSVNIRAVGPKGRSWEGSGFFITSNGIIGTCAHVVQDARALIVNVNIFTNKDKKITKLYQADVVGWDENTDVALIKIREPDMEFSYYRLADKDYEATPLTRIAMAGYPLGSKRFESISINEGKVQSYNKDTHLRGELSKIERIYVDLTGHPGNSGSGVINTQTGECIGVFAGASLDRTETPIVEMNFAIPVKYLWDLIDKISS